MDAIPLLYPYRYLNDFRVNRAAFIYIERYFNGFGFIVVVPHHRAPIGLSCFVYNVDSHSTGRNLLVQQLFTNRSRSQLGVGGTCKY